MKGLAASRSICSIVGILFALASLPAMAAEQQEAAAAVAFADGLRFFQEQRDQEAADRFGRVLELEPRNGAARYWLGLALLRLGKPGEARDEIERGLREGAASQVDPLWVRHDLGAAELAAGDAEAAAKTLGAVAAELEKRLAKEQREGARLDQRFAHQTARNAPESRQEEEGSLDPVEAAEWDLEARHEARREQEALLARTLRRQGEALDKLGRPAEAAAARDRATTLVPEDTGPAIVAPPWEGDLPLLAAVRPWEGSVGFEMVADSNPSLLSEGLALDTPAAGIDLISAGQSDEAAQAGLRLLANPDRSFGGWRLGASFEGRQASYQELDYFNSGELRGVVSLVRGGAPLGTLNGPLGPVRVGADAGLHPRSFLLQAGVDHLLLDGSGYLTTAEGSASFFYRPSSFRSFQADLHLRDLSYATEPVAGRRSGLEIRLALWPSFFWGTGLGERSLRLGVMGGDRNAGPAFESWFLRGTAEAAWPLPGRLNLALLGAWQKDTYTNPESDLLFFVYNPVFPVFTPLPDTPEPRRDTTLRATAALSRPWRKVLWTARFAWIDRDSSLKESIGNQTVDFGYTRTIVSLGASWLF